MSTTLFVAESITPQDQFVPEHVAILDGNGQVVAFNDAWQRFAAQHGLRFNVGENYAQACHDAVGTGVEHGSALAAGIRAVIGGELPEFSAVLPVGEFDERQWLRVRVHRVDGENQGRIVVTQALLEASDYDNRSHGESGPADDPATSYHLEFAARQAAEARDGSCHSLLQRVSRELRTPLNAVIGFSHLLLKEPLGERQLQKVRYVHEAGRTLLELVDNMLEYASLDRGDFELQEQTFDVRNLVQEVVTTAQPVALEKHLPIRYLITEDVPTAVVGDRERLRHVLTTLVHNAVKFTPRGRVLVEVAFAGSDATQLRVRFCISDTGVGIAPERRKLLFGEDPSGTGAGLRDFDVAGIGLALARRLIARMGGKLALRSEPGKGATFEFETVFQPVARAAESASSSATNREPDSYVCEQVGDSAGAEHTGHRFGLEDLGQAVLDENWSTVERLCGAIIDGDECHQLDGVSVQALRLTLAARRRSAHRARDIFRALAQELAKA
ncbi:MAG: HAMP domain-containing histidine kinase [Pirellulales bacterium]|nr:HAMP domain-containing histidine kinase [Pirellulales bacterium]